MCHSRVGYQPGATCFVTFRTEDSIPHDVSDAWYRRRDDWLRRHGINPARSNWKSALQKLPEYQEREYHGTFSREYEEYLDRGHGACVLKQTDLAQIVAESLLHFDGDRYVMGDLVVMPNHVHLLTCPSGATDIERLCHSWKKYTATRINRRLGRRGRFWQEESFDHLVRSPEEFDYLRTYIADNPHKAGLREGEFYYRRGPM